MERGLADIICDEPLAARLKFEPRGRGNADDNYYLVRDSVRSQPRSNQLVFKTCTVMYKNAVFFQHGLRVVLGHSEWCSRAHHRLCLSRARAMLSEVASYRTAHTMLVHSER